MIILEGTDVYMVTTTTARITLIIIIHIETQHMTTVLVQNYFCTMTYGKHFDTELSYHSLWHMSFSIPQDPKLRLQFGFTI